uniref:Serine incorporator n=1 Tax=Rhizochromulina marina TaxID=1034831 RepID=A0A7S2RGK7_9STRA|mmetsp:Transcript_16015/g.46981  ORF Transcript_16015/g.46981 Transcript_16015/m.46981 type:complete len:448 (+) Transcript_16015:36-1379(+)
MFIVSGAASACCMVAEGACCLCSTATCCARCCGRSSKSDEGNGESPSSNKAGFGRVGSLLLQITAISVALAGQGWLYEYVKDEEAWDCDEKPTCVQYAFTERVAFVATLFFAVMAIIGKLMPKLHDQGWDLKFIVFMLVLLALMWAPSTIFDEHGYVWFARVFAFIFLILQQIILIDFAYTMNDYLYKFNQWVLLGASLFLYAASLTGICLMFVYFKGCRSNEAFISLCLIAIVIFTIIQLLSNPELGHNLLTSSAVASYITYLTYVAVSSNPTGERCNPTLSDSKDTLAVFLGMGMVLISLVATVYFASTSMTQLLNAPDGDAEAQSPGNEQLTRDLLTGDLDQPSAGVAGTTSGRQSFNVAMRDSMMGSSNSAIVLYFNLVMLLICQYWCMVLTNWGDSSASNSNSSPAAGDVVMWMNISASWVCCLLYIWSLVAPMIFPDRDFS